MKIRFFFLGALLVFVPILCSHSFVKAESISENTKTILRELSSKFKDIKTYKAKIRMITGDGKNDLEQTGILYYKAPHFYRLELYIGSTLQDIIIKNKDGRWHYNKWLKLIFKYGINQNFNNNMDLINLIDNYVTQKNIIFLGTKEIDGDLLYCFEGKFSTDNANIYKFYLQKNGITKRIKMNEQNGNFRIIQEFSSVMANIPLDMSLFDFVPPEGVQIIDRSIKKENNRQRLRRFS